MKCHFTRKMYGKPIVVMRVKLRWLTMMKKQRFKRERWQLVSRPGRYDIFY